MNLLKILNDIEPNGELFDTETALRFGRKVAEQTIEQVIKSFPSHEHPEIVKAILNVMDEIERN